MTKFFACLGVLMFVAPALANPNLKLTLSAPSGIAVYQAGTYGVTVLNNGKKSAFGTKVVINLPATSTSPTVHVLGQLSGLASGCTLAGTKLTCQLGTLAKGATVTKTFNFAGAYSSAPMVISASSSTTTYENDLSDNNASKTLALATISTAVVTGVEVPHEHCTGTNLTSYYECELYPSSISVHHATFLAGGGISITGQGTYSGSWWQSSPDRLQFQYFEGPDLAATFDGRGVGGGCFEGLTTFPGSSYVSPYQICF